MHIYIYALAYVYICMYVNVLHVSIYVCYMHGLVHMTNSWFAVRTANSAYILCSFLCMFLCVYLVYVCMHECMFVSISLLRYVVLNEYLQIYR